MFAVVLLAGVRSGIHLFNKTLEMKQTSGLARSPHSWHGGGVAEGTRVHKYIYIYIYVLVRPSAFHARNMFDSVLSAIRINDPALLSVTGLAGPVLFR